MIDNGHSESFKIKVSSIKINPLTNVAGFFCLELTYLCQYHFESKKC